MFSNIHIYKRYFCHIKWEPAAAPLAATGTSSSETQSEDLSDLNPEHQDRLLELSLCVYLVKQTSCRSSFVFIFLFWFLAVMHGLCHKRAVANLVACGFGWAH